MTIGDWLAAATTILVFILTILVGLIAYIFRDLNATVSRHGRHIQSLLANDSELLWRMTGAEEFMVKELEYQPPRLVRRQWQDNGQL